MLQAAKETIAKAATEVDRLRALLLWSKDFYRANPKQAEKWAREALKLAKKLKDAEAEARAHYTVGAALFEMSDLSEAAKEFEIAASLDRPAEFTSPLLDRPLIALGRTLSKQGKYQEAVQYFERALTMSRAHHRKSEVDILTAIGNAALEQADYPRALDMQYQALALLDTEDDPLRRSVVLSNIARVYLEVHHLDKADLFFERSQLLSKEREDFAGLASITANRGLVAKERMDATSAAALFAEALGYAKRVDRQDLECYVQDALGGLALSKGNTKEALKAFNQSIEIAESLEIRTVVCSAMNGKGRTLIELKKLPEAIRSLQSSERMCDESGLLALQAEAIDLLVTANERAGKLKEALAAYKRLRTLNLTLNSQQKQRELLEIAARVEIEKADRERERLVGIAKDAESRAEVFRNETEKQSKELTQLALQLVEKNEFLCDLKEELEPQLKSSKQAKALAQKIDDHIRSDRDWETFENQFSAVHRDFLTRLSAKFPALTPTELKIATMIKLNLPTKAIANLFCLSARTVENHRLSIRRKIGLSGDENLVSFFTAFGSNDESN